MALREDRPPSEPRRPSRWWYVVFALAVVGVAYQLTGDGERTLDYSSFVSLLEQDRITGTVEVGEMSVRGRLTEGGENVPFRTTPPPGAEVAKLLEGKVAYTGVDDSSSVSWLWIPIVLACLLFAFWALRLMGMRGRGGTAVSALQFGRHRARIHTEADTKTTFEDVAGVDEAVEEVKEVVDYLSSPERFEALGGRIPKGVILLGMPGTGKTLLARAVAGEASVPFLSISGADFVEMFAGVGASRVRDLFAKAKELSPCIVFIDELDALGKARGVVTGGSEEREQTLNQLLVEMDGFLPNAGVIVLAATNRPEVLDRALLRAGRFDRQIVVDRPDVRGRLQILRIHARRIAMGRTVDLAVIARRTPGFTGADLATLVNEGALLAARRGRDQVGMAHIEEAIDRVLAGLERKSRLISPREKAVVAVHETGHAMVASLIPRADPVHRVSVIPRGVAAAGMTLQLQREERNVLSRTELLDRIAVLLGGRAAEQVVFDDVSTGAANDLQKVTDLAYRMVADFGMSERLGPVSLAGPDSPRFLPAEGKPGRAMSDDTKREVDLEVRRIVEEQEKRVLDLLTEHKRRLVAIARVLREKETLDAGAFEGLMKAPFKQREPAESPTTDPA